MKRFIKNILVFIFLVFIFNIFLYVFVSQFFSPDSYYQKVVQAPPQTTTIILADSHGIYFNDALLRNANIQNMSYASDSYIDMYRKLEFSIENYPISEVVITVDRHTLSPYREAGVNSYLSRKLNDYGEWPYTLFKYFPVFDVPSISILQGYVLTKFGNLVSWISRTEGSGLGNSTDWFEAPNKLSLARARVAGQFPSLESSIELFKELQNIVNLCEYHSVDLIGVRFPVTKEYFKEVENFDYEAKEFLENKGITVLDYENIFFNIPEYFSDQDHINDEGGTVLSNLIISDLEKLRD